MTICRHSVHVLRQLCYHSCRYASLSFSNTNTALLPVNTYKSRSLLSVESSSVDDVQPNKALMTVSTGLTNYKMDAEFDRNAQTSPRSEVLPDHGLHACSCPNRSCTDGRMNKQVHNRTLFEK